MNLTTTTIDHIYRPSTEISEALGKWIGTDYTKYYRKVEFDAMFPFSLPSIKKVIFNEPATIVLWSDRTKTVVKCMDGDIYSPEVGLAMCICKKALGKNFKKTFREHLKDAPDIKEKEIIVNGLKVNSSTTFDKFIESMKKALCN